MIDPKTRAAIFSELKGPVQDIIQKHLGKPDLEIDEKPDKSRVTKMDRAVNEELVAWLKAKTPYKAVVAEEESHDDNVKAARQETYWELDAIDGTDASIEYHKQYKSGANPDPKTAEFSVLLSLIHNGTPVFGAIWFPVQQTLYSIDDQGKAFRQTEDRARIPLTSLISEKPISSWSVSCSPEKYDPCPQLPTAIANPEIKRSSGIFKLLWPMTGDAHLANLGAGFKTWDVSAADAIARAAGGMAVTSGRPIKYNADANENFSLPAFQLAPIPILEEVGLLHKTHDTLPHPGRG